MKMTVKIKPVTIAPMDRKALMARMRKVNSVIAVAANSGKNKIHQTSDMYSSFISANSLQLHARQIFHVRGLAAAIERDDEREADRDFRRRDGDDEKHQHLSIELVVESRERDEREVRGVQHQLQRHINHNQIAPHDDAEQSQRKQQKADGQIMFESDVHFILC